MPPRGPRSSSSTSSFRTSATSEAAQADPAGREQTGVRPGGCFVDFFAGSGVVARWAKLLGYRVIANDWEPYSQVINRCYIACNRPPAMAAARRVRRAIERLNRLPPVVGWVTEHLCPRDDEHFDVERDRMFYMRKNGMRIDAIREQIAAWKRAGAITDLEEACLLAPLVYQACYTSNTSGVFKGFHNGWGGQTATALYRIAGDLRLEHAGVLRQRRGEPGVPRGCASAGRAARAPRRSTSPISTRLTISIPTAATITCSIAWPCGTSRH